LEEDKLDSYCDVSKELEGHHNGPAHGESVSKVLESIIGEIYSCILIPEVYTAVPHLLCRVAIFYIIKLIIFCCQVQSQPGCFVHCVRE